MYLLVVWINIKSSLDLKPDILWTKFWYTCTGGNYKSFKLWKLCNKIFFHFNILRPWSRTPENWVIIDLDYGVFFSHFWLSRYPTQCQILIYCHLDSIKVEWKTMVFWNELYLKIPSMYLKISSANIRSRCVTMIHHGVKYFFKIPSTCIQDTLNEKITTWPRFSRKIYFWNLDFQWHEDWYMDTFGGDVLLKSYDEHLYLLYCILSHYKKRCVNKLAAMGLPFVWQ